MKDIRNDKGEVTIWLKRLRPAGSPGVAGSGGIVTLNFVAVGKGTSTITLVQFETGSLKNPQLQTINFEPIEGDAAGQLIMVTGMSQRKSWYRRGGVAAGRAAFRWSN